MIEPIKTPKSKNFIVNLGDDKVAPALAVKVKPVKTKTGKVRKNTFTISIVHPNTGEVIHEKTYRVSGDNLTDIEAFNEAFKVGNEIKEEIQKNIPTWFEEKKFIPAPKKGSMKLNTEEVKPSAKKTRAKKKTKAVKKKKATKKAKKVAKKKTKTTRKKKATKKVKKTRKNVRK